MSAYFKKSDLSPARRELVELLQRVNFGTIHQLAVRNREPVLNPMPRLVREIKFNAENGPRPEIALPSFRMKFQWCELFALLDAIGNGTIESLEFKNGIPFKTLVVEPAASN